MTKLAGFVFGLVLLALTGIASDAFTAKFMST